MSKQRNQLIALTLVGVLVAGVVAAISVQSYQRHREAAARFEAGKVEAAVLRAKMVSAYRHRKDLLRDWIGTKTLAKDVEFDRLLKMDDGLDLLTQPGVDRYDWVQDQISHKAVTLLVHKKTAKKKPKDWETIESEVADARIAYVKKVIGINRLGNLPGRLPIFREEAALASTP